MGAPGRFSATAALLTLVAAFEPPPVFAEGLQGLENSLIQASDDQRHIPLGRSTDTWPS